MKSHVTAALAAALCLFASPMPAATFVYVSNAEDADIGVYSLQADGSLKPGARVKAEKVVMPMSVSPDKRFLVAAVRSKPFSAYTYTIDRGTGALTLVGTGPLAESVPYITHDRTGRYLLSASYGGHLVSVNPLGADGRAGAPMQTIPTARNAHAIIVDPGRNVDNDIWASDLHLTPNGRFLYAAERTSSSIGAFGVDAASGKLTWLGSTPTEKQPRGFRIDPGGRFMVVSGEKSDMLSSYAIDPSSGALRQVGRYPTGKGSNWVEIVSFD